MAYTKLANSILTSTVWMEEDRTRIVWFALMAMADKNGEVQASIPGLANIARVPIEDCRKAIQTFLSPDSDSRSKDNDGRRLMEIDGGWYLINHPKYRKLASDEDRREKAAIRQARWREVTHSNASNAPVTLPLRQKSQAEADTKADTKKENNLVRDANATVIYKFYPRKVGKPAAIKAIKRALMRFSYELVLEKTKAYATARAGEDQQFTPHPATWFNQQRFNDDSSTWKKSHATNQTNRNAGIVGHNQGGISKAERVLAHRAQIAKESAELALANQVAGNGINPSVSAGTSQQGTILL
jgi:hypothetical protein